nr:RluA family pseudouridine synthase [Buchnera aphidicola]
MSVEKFNSSVTFLKKEKIFIDIVHDDLDFLIINKSSNFVVHPGIKHTSGTLLNAILYYFPNNISLPRAGIVHRLDKNTTGLMIIAKTLNSYNYFIKILKKRKVIREYDAIVFGQIFSNNIINRPIKRHIYCRTKMMIHLGGKKAITHYTVINIFKNFTHLRLKLETGRTHQIRVHLNSIQHPLLGDPIYNSFRKITSKKIESSTSIFLKKILKKYTRQALHASFLKFKHPITSKIMKWEQQPPNDFKNVLNALYNNGYF